MWTLLCLAIFVVLATCQYPEGSLYSPRISNGYGNWSTAYTKARAFVCNLTVTEKVNLTTSVGTGMTYSYSVGIIPRFNFRGLALDDSPTGVRSADYSSAFAAPLNMAMSWDRNLIYAQAYANGAEHKAKGINIAFAPVVGPLGRAPEGGRIWESYSPDPYLSGIGFGLSVAGMNAGDDMATRIMASFFFLGQDQNFPELNFAQGDLATYGDLYPHDMVDFTQINQHVDVRDAHAQIIRELGANSIVMVKNVNDTLPLKAPKQLAIIGEDAGPSLFGPNGCPDRGCDNGTLAMGWGSGSTNFPYLVDPLSAIQTRALQDRTVVQYVLDNYDTSLIDSVVSQATTCLVFINCDSGEGYIEVGGNYGDRNNLTVWMRGDDLVNEVAGNCSNTIVIAHTPGPIIIEPWIENPNVTALSDGQPEAPTGIVTELSDGQPEAPVPTAAPVTEASEGQPEAPVTEASEGQPEAPTATAVTEASEGQPEQPTAT
ncbi:beta-glucosidase [Zalaria obscura]|uniref:Beta-glucosidase n=1 Tax=Zalaria obscura TaxID=2024903 RepID=A0ACC3SEA9_9PEZI